MDNRRDQEASGRRDTEENRTGQRRRVIRDEQNYQQTEYDGYPQGNDGAYSRRENDYERTDSRAQSQAGGRTVRQAQNRAEGRSGRRPQSQTGGRTDRQAQERSCRGWNDGYTDEGYRRRNDGYTDGGYQRYAASDGRRRQSGAYREGYSENGRYQDDPRYYQSRENYEEPYPSKNGKRKKKKKHRKLLFALELLVLLVVAGGLFVVAQLNRMGRVSLKDIVINSGISRRGYRNLALFGVDSREGDLESGTNSDTIMVCSINQKSGEIKLVSVYRDTYLDVSEGHYSKANSAYAGGGAERAVNMLNKNLDLDITDFVTVDFNAVIKAVDLLGGIDLELTDEEVKWLNAYLVETSQVTGVSYTEVPSSGMQHLTGIQAMAFCRIRYTEGWDYKRTERQRIVLEKIFQAAQQQGVTGLAGLINTMLPYIKTSLGNTEMLSLAAGIGSYSIVDTQGFPYDKVAANVDAGDCVVPVSLASNVSQLHQYLFNDSGYTPSDTVQAISSQIINNTGIQ